MEPNPKEQTLVLIKPDALKNSLTGYIMSQLSEFHTGLRYAAAKIISVNRMLAEEHYSEHKGKVFFDPLIDYITGAIHYPNEPEKRRVKAFVFQGPDAIATIRSISGPTNPHVAREQKPGCIRSLGTVVPIKDAAGNIVDYRMDNLIHASANLQDAEREIKLWFRPSDIPPFMRIFPIVTCNNFYYFKEGKLLEKFEPGSLNIVAPGDIVWGTDLLALQELSKGNPSTTTLDGVAAKYLVNK